MQLHRPTIKKWLNEDHMKQSSGAKSGLEAKMFPGLIPLFGKNRLQYPKYGPLWFN